tara:strand:- start:779 stop:1027 length:249 start_codon:yes stop_codon:yes gene_type:complete
MLSYNSVQLLQLFLIFLNQFQTNLKRRKLMTMTKQRAFYKWLEECPVEFQYQMEFNSKQEDCTDEMYIFRGIPNVEIVKEKS